MVQLPRVMADTRQGGALFIVGMHIHDWGKPFDWLPAFLAMPRMVRELEANRALGMVSARYSFWGGAHDCSGAVLEVIRTSHRVRTVRRLRASPRMA